ncbi:MAG: transcription termination/antitermination protein NusG [Candidatus Omnitrophota bacterium]
MVKKWYVIHTQTGQEDKVRAGIESRIEAKGLKDKISNILVPTERISEVKEGKKRILQRKFFPGYILIEMEMDDNTWYLIKSTPGVAGFIGQGNKPFPLKKSEIEAIIKQTAEKKEKPQPKVIFEKGEAVRVKEGPFTNFNGVIEEVNPDKQKLKVMVSIFGRSTPVELEYWQVERV